MNTKANGNSDEDCLFLEQVLDKLYDFGTNKRKKKRKRREDEEGLPRSTQRQDLQPEQKNGSGQKHSQVEVVTFQDPRKKLKNKPTGTPDKGILPQTKDQEPHDQTEGISLEKARFEVHRFGITGYKKEQQRVFEQDRAVMLGAQPPKKQYVNYKVMQQQIKEKKQKQKEEVDPELKKKKKKKQNNPKEKKRQSSLGSGSGPSGQVGRFKNGMLILSSKEIQKIKGSKRKR